MTQAMYFVIFGLLSFAIYGSFNLSIRDFKKKNVCPKILSIPACYIVVLFFVLALLSHALPSIFSNSWWYYGFIAVPFLLALSGTLTELSGKVICPRTPGGTPMCYISLAMCTSFLVLKFAENSLL